MPQPQPAQRPGPRQQGFTVERKGERKPFKPKPWSHQDDLAALKGQFVAFKTVLGPSGNSITGRLLDADNFTVKFEIGKGLPPTIIFKHAIVMLSAVPEREQ